MTGVHQLLVSASPGDAVTDTTFESGKLLGLLGPSYVGARYWDPALTGAVVSLEDLREKAAPGDALIYHASIGEPGIVEYVESWEGPVVLQYHNMTPATYFHGVDKTLAVRLTEGREQLAQLVGRADAVLAASRFNAAELTLLGYKDVRVVPLIVDVQRLLDTEPSAGTLRHFEVNEGPVFFFLGQLLPHKRPDLLIRAYHLLVTFHRPDAHLVMAGSPRIEAYHAHLRRMIFELNLPRCWLAGRVSRPDLVAFYRTATAFVTASEHEGVCLPLFEAMAFGVPIITRACAAIPETIGGAGIVLPCDDDPGLMCEAMIEMIDNADGRAQLVASGTLRLAELQQEAADSSLLEVLGDVL